MNSKIGIIGHFAHGNDFYDGQTVKTKILYQELKKKDVNIFCVDTYKNKCNKVSLLVDTLKCIFMCNTIIVLVSGNGMRIFFPLLYMSKKLLGRRIYHDVIGGNLVSYIEKYPKYIKYLNSFDSNWVEFKQLKKDLEKKGIFNCDVIPNFKKLDTNKASLKISDNDKHKMCIFSRVMREKGITDAICAINKYNSNNKNKILLQIWGPIDEKYEEEFNQLKITYVNDFKYMGIVKYDQSVQILTSHLALLFPTFWDGEGFPGTIVDAYAAGLPVIASNWSANSELIDNFETGLVYPNECVNDLYESICWAMDHCKQMEKMRINAINKSKEYMPDYWVNKIIMYLGGKYDI